MERLHALSRLLKSTSYRSVLKSEAEKDLTLSPNAATASRTWLAEAMAPAQVAQISISQPLSVAHVPLEPGTHLRSECRPHQKLYARLN